MTKTLYQLTIRSVPISLNRSNSNRATRLPGVSPAGTWENGDWSVVLLTLWYSLLIIYVIQCQEPCDIAQQARAVECYVFVGNQSEQHPGMCDNTTKPTGSRKCPEQDCAHWTVEEWEKVCWGRERGEREREEGEKILSVDIGYV